MTWPKALRVDADDSPSGWWGTIFPVGAIFLSTVNVDPGSSLGFGTWSLYAQGRVLMAPPGPSSDLFFWQRVS